MDWKLKSEIVEFENSEGEVVGRVIVKQATFLEDQKLDEMEEAAARLNEEELKNLDGQEIPEKLAQLQLFRMGIYPKMAACSTGDIPSLEEAFENMPSSETNKWWVAAKNCNPLWFEIFESIEKMSEENLKKKLPKQAESSLESAS